MELDKFKENLEIRTFGLSKEYALQHGICIQCREPAMQKCYSSAGRKEYGISGLCEECFDSIMEED